MLLLYTYLLNWWGQIKQIRQINYYVCARTTQDEWLSSVSALNDWTLYYLAGNKIYSWVVTEECSGNIYSFLISLKSRVGTQKNATDEENQQLEERMNKRTAEQLGCWSWYVDA